MAQNDIKENAAKTTPNNSASRAILQKLELKQYYDAYQMVTALINRNIAKGHHLNAISLCVTWGNEFNNHHQFSLGAGLGMLMIKVFKEFELDLNESRVDDVLKLFKVQPSTYCEERFSFIERALKWAHEEAGNTVSPHSTQNKLVQQLHDAAGIAYRDAREFGMSQGHFLRTGNIQQLAILIKTWREYGYTSERELFLLRIVLTLLAKGETLKASDLVQSPTLGLNFDNPQLPPPLQLAYLLPEACKLQTPHFFDTVKAKYSLVLRRDPTFGKLMNAIDTCHFGRSASKPDIFSIMSGILQ